MMKSGMGIRKCNPKFAVRRPERLDAYPTRKRKLNRLSYARRSARLRDRNRGFDRKTVGTNSCKLAQALLLKRHLKIPDQAHWICQRMAGSAMFRIMQRNRREFLILDHTTLITSNRILGRASEATVGTNFGRVFVHSHSLALRMAVARNHVQQSRQLPKGNYAAKQTR